MIENDEKGLEKVLNPGSHFPGRRNIPKNDEQIVAVDRTMKEIQKGFEVDSAPKKSIQGKQRTMGENHI